MMEKRIMVVDDDPDILITIRKIFEREGYEVFTVDSGMDCIKELERGFKGIVLIDIMMPFMDGWDTIEEITKRGYAKNAKALVVSATFKTFIPVPPNTSFPITTPKTTAKATIQSGVSIGIIKGINIPETK